MNTKQGGFEIMKRFVETSRFQEPWYADLPPEMKVAFEYLWSHCDNAGIWVANTKMADFVVGKKINWVEFLHRLAGKVADLGNGRWMIRGFIEMQCGRLSPDSRPHQVVISILRSNGLFDEHSASIIYPDSLSIDYVKGMHTLQEQYKDKDKDKDKDSDKDKEGVQGEVPRSRRDRGSMDEIAAFCAELGLPKSDAEWCFEKWQGSGWKNGGNAIKDWRATIRSWKAAGYMASQKNGATKPKNGIAITQSEMPPIWDPLNQS